ncbi:hypothetical protein K3495_g1819 [Podosphaera aphanis]|nr:hypothetical protein K3495_g1819 [Podosphaera aphanis]
MTNVQLFIYDLSNGLARQLSLGLLGKQIDAIYHTSIVMENLEYVYDGGIKAVPAGKTHLGPPLKTEFLGKTELPKDVITQYLESLREKYTEKAYDIWKNNCNHFSDEFATFLVGHGIPGYISNLPQDVLMTPFGQMMKPHIDQMARQAQANKGGLLGIQDTKSTTGSTKAVSNVIKVTSQAELDMFLQQAQRSCAVVFFTSQNCPPCHALYPTYHKLAAEAGKKSKFLLVDVATCPDVGMKYSIKATPTFITFLNGTINERWMGSNQTTLKNNVDTLLRIASPPHPHDSLALPTFLSASTQTVSYEKIPPLENLKKKLGSFTEDSDLQGVLKYISDRTGDGKAEAPLSIFESFSNFLNSAPSKLPTEILFIVVDIFRVCMADPKVSKYYAEEKTHKIVADLISYVNSLENCPYSLRLVTLQLACNLFTSISYQPKILSCPILIQTILQLISNSLLEEKHLAVRVAAASLVFNIAVTNRNLRTDQDQGLLPETEQVELIALILEGIRLEKESPESLKGLLLALANLIYRAPEANDFGNLLEIMDAQEVVLSKQKLFPQVSLVEEIGKVLLGKNSK